MDVNEILSFCDHTLLSVEADFEQIKNIVDDGIKYNTASVCLPPCYVKKASEYANKRVEICTVIGFPNGYNSTKVKVFETKQALKDGADEIDMVINVGALKSGQTDYVLNEIKKIKKATKNKVLKVIIETCLLTESEKIIACDLVTKAGADYIKTSTGFSKHGATVEDVKLLKNNVGKAVKVKAAGGISNLEDAEQMLNAGASRLGTSKVVKIVKSKKES